MGSSSLISYLSKLTDKRRSEGKRHDLVLILLITIMATMSRFLGYRGISRFVKKNQEALKEHLKPAKDRLPSLATIRRVLMNIDFDEFSELFKLWALEQINLIEEDWVSIDGKSLKNTLQDYDSQYQNFVSIVSAYSRQSGLVISVEQYENKKISEIEVVDKMVKNLGISGAIFTMDALHCKKNA